MKRFFKNHFDFHNMKYGGWVTVLPSIGFYLIGWRSKKNFIWPTKLDGLQITVCWLWFQLEFSTVPFDRLYESL